MTNDLVIRKVPQGDVDQAVGFTRNASHGVITYPTQ